MNPDRDRLELLAGAVFDGTPVDWSREHADSDSDEQVRILRNLEFIARISDAHARMLKDACADPELARKVAFLESTSFDSLGSQAAGVAAEPTDAVIPLRQVDMASGSVLGRRYRIDHFLGRGGMGEVWQAYDLKLGVEVALKSVQAARATPHRREALRREVRAARSVISPHVCRIYDLIEIDSQEFISMEFVDGAHLREYLDRCGSLPLSEAAEIASQLLAGLQAIHDSDLVHLDLKPENVLRTRTGRVVVTDFGIAKDIAEAEPGSTAGTPAYMAPEQAAGEAVDARADIYAAGMVLAELVHGDSPASREALRTDLHHDPALLPEGPWRDVLCRAIAVHREDRFPSARALATALEEVTARATTDAQRNPYPGLAPFTESDSQYFFGREAEIESLLKKLQRLHMLALVGPSGVGKTSLVRAGLISALPEDWALAYCTPGTSPFVALGQALAPEFAGEPEAVRACFQFDWPEIATSLFTRWRRSRREAVLVVDQFEELFTQNPAEVQERFTELLGQLSLVADVRILLLIRDDYLIHCHHHPSLQPILLELTLLTSPRGEDLRRVLIRPSLACGYRFEDEGLVDRMVAEVEAERGALPLLTFTASRLWEARDRTQRILTRRAYEEIGGVEGSLAQHAEAALERIGVDREPIVREIFRNLLTARGTRVSREHDELLSVFEDRQAASSVLSALVDARLLTSFEVLEPRSTVPRQRVEVIHESLLSNWSRLVRWQTQDADGAQLRDQLRQVAKLWDERGRPADLLWTGTVYHEFRVWRERYPGGLTSIEGAFAHAMEIRARRSRQRMRAATVTAFAVLLTFLGVVGVLWLRSRRAERASIAEARRAEASKLMAFTESNSDPQEAVPLAVASLRLSDQPEARERVVELLEQGPLPFVFATSPVRGQSNPAAIQDVAFSPDGGWFAVGWGTAQVQLWRTGSDKPIDLSGLSNGVHIGRVVFSEDSRYCAVSQYNDSLHVYATGDPQPIAVLGFPGNPQLGFSQELGCFLACVMPEAEWKGPTISTRWYAVPPRGAPRDLGTLVIATPSAQDQTAVMMSPQGRIVVQSNHGAVVYEFRNGSFRQLRRIGLKNCGGWIDPRGRRLVTTEGPDAYEVWSLDRQSSRPTVVLHGGEERLMRVCFDPMGNRIAMVFQNGLRVWDLSSPAWMGPMVIGSSEGGTGCFYPSGEWIVTARSNVSAWPLTRRYRTILPGDVSPKDGHRGVVAFSPDGRWLATARDGSIRLWPLEGDSSPHEIATLQHVGEGALKFSPSGEELYTSVGKYAGEGWGGTPAGIIGIDIRTGRTVFRGPQRFIVHDFHLDPRARRVISFGNEETLTPPEVNDLASGSCQPINLPGNRSVRPVGFAADGRLVLLRLKNAYNSNAPETLARTGPDTLYAMDLVTKSLEQLSASVDWICRGHSGLFLWADSTGHAWLGDPASGQPRMVHLAPTVRGFLRNFRLSHHRVDLDSTRVVLARQDWIEVYDYVGDAPHLLRGNPHRIYNVAIDPLGRWIASGDENGELRLWPIPTGVPLQTLAHDQLLAKLDSLTNWEIVRDPKLVGGYRMTGKPFPGWDPAPSW